MDGIQFLMAYIGFTVVFDTLIMIKTKVLKRERRLKEEDNNLDKGVEAD